MKKKQLFSVLFFVMALVMTILVACPKPEEEKILPPGEETGLYYFLQNGKEQSIVLSNGDKFSFYVHGISKSGTYTLEEGVLTLTFYKEEGQEERQTITGQLENDTIALTYYNNELIFYKRVDRTVSFNTGGGSSIEKVTLLNGQYLDRPSDPTYDGYDFEGWYTDQECTKPFMFKTQRVLSDLTLYALWIPQTASAVSYKIDFDLNFESTVKNPDSAYTSGGKIYSLPDPSGRTGYQFKGWWISHYNDGSKLSVKMPDNIDSIEFKEDTTLYAYWQKASTGTKFPNPVVRVEGDNVVWEGIVGAVYYELQVFEVIGENNHKEVFSTTDTVTTIDVGFSALKAGDYKINLKAHASNPADSSESTVYYKNKAMTRVSHFRVVEPSVLVFNEVENATNYIISVDCGDQVINLTDYDNGKKTSFNFFRFPMTEEGITFTVTTAAEGYASSSRQFTYNRRLQKIQKLYFDKESEVLTWDAVDGATNYILSISSDNSLPLHESIDIGNNTSYCLKEHSGDIVVNIIPKAKGWNSPSPVTYEYKKDRLATPRNIIIQNKTIKWEEVANATGYELFIQNQTYTADTNSLEIIFNIVAGKEYKMIIKAVGEKESLWSDEIVICDNLSGSLMYLQNIISWNHIVGATNYKVAVNGEIQAEVEAGTNFAEVTLTKGGINIITVTAFFEDESQKTAEIEVYANTIRFESMGGEQVDEIYIASGDKITLPIAKRAGYGLINWYTSWDGGQTFNSAYTDTYFTEQGDLTLYAHWGPTTIRAVYDYGDGQGSEYSKEIVFGSEFKLEVPAIEDGRVFGGWFTEQDGKGTKIANEQGNGIGPWNLTEDTLLYAFWANALDYHQIEKAGVVIGWQAKRGVDVYKLSSIKIPEKVKDLPVLEIDAYAFEDCERLEKVEIPATINFIGDFAFLGCVNLQEIIIDPKNTVFKIENGMVFQIDAETGERELKFFTSALKGEYIIPSDITEINSFAFATSSGISKITIHKDVEKIDKGAFSYCTALSEVVFEEGINLTIFEENLFAGCVSLTEITIPNSVEKIGVGVFDGCVNLEEVKFEEGGENPLEILKSSYNQAAPFRHCRSLKKIAFPARTKLIDENAFKDCTALAEVTFTENTILEKIGRDAFRNTGVTSITIPANVNILYDYAFADCKQLSEVTIEEGSKLTELGWYLFMNCQALEKVTIGKDSAIKTIGREAFVNCISLHTVNFNNIGLQSIGWYAFKNCISLKTIVLPDSLTQLNNEAFYNCKALESINIPAGITYIDKSVFQYCDTFFEVHKDNPNFSSDGGILFSKDKKTLVIYPGKKGTQYTVPKTVERIGEYAFYYKNITSITIPASIKYVDSYAFFGCEKLSSVTFEDGTNILEIGSNVFEGCILLENIKFPKRLTRLFGSVFKDCVNLKEVDFGEDSNLEGGIGSSAFYGCVSLTEIVIPIKVTEIGSYCFENCTNLRRVILQEGSQLSSYGIQLGAFRNSALEYINLEVATSITGINSYAFENTKIRSITIPDNVTRFSTEVFKGCDQLLEVNIGYNSQMSSIGTRTFSGCINLRNIFIPQKVTSVANAVFTDCVSLVNVDVHPNNTSLSSINGVLFNKNRSELRYYPIARAGAYQIPSSVSSIGTDAFAGNKGLSAISFEDKFAFIKIGNNAFLGCTALSIFEFPENIVVDSIGSNAFKDCTALTTIYLPKDVFGINNTAFIGCLNLREILVHEGNYDYSSIDGVLFNKAKSLLHTFPAGKSGAFMIPKTVTTINQSAFAYSHRLEKITFETGSELTIINNNTFQYSGLKSIELPNGLQRLNNNAFEYSGLESIIIPDTVTYIGTYIFANCVNLKSVVLSKGITNIGSYCFKGSGIEKIEIPANVEYIGSSAFEDCKNLKEITIVSERETRLQFSSSAFKGCSGLTSLYLPALSDGAYYTFGTYVFEDCTSLEIVEIAGGTDTTSNQTFRNCISLKKVILHDDIEFIGSNAFEGCVSLSEIYLPKNLTRIQSSAFANCTSLTSIVIPYQTEIFSAAFAGWTANQTIYIVGRFTPGDNWSSDWYADCSAKIVWGA